MAQGADRVVAGSCRYHKQNSMGGTLQPAGSLASSMSNLSSLQLGAGGRCAAAAVSSTGGAGSGAKGAAAKMSAAGAAAAAASGAPGSQYVSPYGQQQRR